MFVKYVAVGGFMKLHLLENRPLIQRKHKKKGAFITLIFLICWILLFLLAGGTAHAGFQVSTVAAKWDGIWQPEGEKIGIMSISEKDGFFNMIGKDAASIYSCSGIIEGNTAQCLGHGVNHDMNLRFLYKSKMVIGEDGQQITEEWEALFPDGRTLQGKGVFIPGDASRSSR